MLHPSSHFSGSDVSVSVIVLTPVPVDFESGVFVTPARVLSLLYTAANITLSLSSAAVLLIVTLLILPPDTGTADSSPPLSKVTLLMRMLCSAGVCVTTTLFTYIGVLSASKPMRATSPLSSGATVE